MSAGRRSSTTSYAPTWVVVPATTLFDCVANSPDQSSCASSVAILAGGNFTELRDANGVDKPFAAAPAGYVHGSDVSQFNASAICVVYYGKR